MLRSHAAQFGEVGFAGLAAVWQKPPVSIGEIATILRTWVRLKSIMMSPYLRVRVRVRIRVRVTL